MASKLRVMVGLILFIGLVWIIRALIETTKIHAIPIPIDSNSNVPIKILWLLRFPEHSVKFFSQTEADGLLYYIFRNIGTTNRYYVEFGTQDGKETNTRWLRETRGWSGLLMDGGHQNLSINLHREFISGININDLFAKYEVPLEFDLLSIDIDYNTYWVWKYLNHTKYRPRVIITEFNPCFDDDTIKVAEFKGWEYSWLNRSHYGASPKAIWELGRSYGYVGVYVDLINMYFIRRDILNLSWEEVNILLPFSQIFRITQVRVQIMKNQQCWARDESSWIEVNSSNPDLGWRSEQ